MGRFPVYQSPELDEVERRLRPGPHRHGYLEGDPRPLIQILTEDEKAVKEAGLYHDAIARRLRALTEAAKRALGEPVVVEDRLRVRVEAARGKLPCPWGHPGLYPKTHVELERLDTGERLQWTDLSIHFIEAHGFYQGAASPYRLDPPTVIRILDLKPEESPQAVPPA
ncbi:MAG: hypothetical protein H5U10_10665 [Desulfacinum sp.]|jgi:hypothetical protein|nr:hypothetical protein [Desulfacinum sp.]